MSRKRWVKKVTRNVSKDIFLNTLACHTLGWLMRVKEVKRPSPPTLGEIFRMEQGRDIEMRARSLYPSGLAIEDADLDLAHKKTMAAIKDPKVSVIFGATFLANSFATKADILQRTREGWSLNEVKSSILDKPEFIDDMAYTAMVAEKCGLKISDASLLLISKDFRLGMGNDRLYVKIDHTNEVLSQVDLFKPLWEQVERITSAPRKPEPKLKFVCKKCGLFEECLGADIMNHILDIPRLSQKKFDALTERGIVRIEDIPDSFALTEIQARIRESVKKNKMFVGAGLKGALESISWPVYYLDFETVMTAIPLYPDIAPYSTIPTQYSVHKCSGVGRDLEHFQFLADPSGDCRKEFAENLIRTLGDSGSVLIYGTLEKTILSGLSNVFSSLSGEINSLVERMISLESIVGANFYHPDFHGSTSLKVVLPVLVPELSYDSLEIKDGDSAMAAFAYLALGRYKGEKAGEVKKNLKAYCAQDTLALCKVHQRLTQSCGSKFEQRESHHQASLEKF